MGRKALLFWSWGSVLRRSWGGFVLRGWAGRGGGVEVLEGFALGSWAGRGICANGGLGLSVEIYAG